MAPEFKVRVFVLDEFLNITAPWLPAGPAVPSVSELAAVRLRLAKVGVAVVVMSWMVLTAPLATVKLVLLKDATPLEAVVAFKMEPVKLLEERLRTKGDVPVAEVSL